MKRKGLTVDVLRSFIGGQLVDHDAVEHPTTIVDVQLDDFGRLSIVGERFSWVVDRFGEIGWLSDASRAGRARVTLHVQGLACTLTKERV